MVTPPPLPGGQQPRSEPGSEESVDALFERWLTELDAGGEDFEAFAARHEDQGAELRELFAAWRLARSAMPAGDSVVRDAASLARSRGNERGESLSGLRHDARGADLRPDLGPGSVVGDYRIERLLGAGGMGQVWEAEELALGRRVALKTLRPGAASIGGARLWHEARTAGGINHPGIVPVFAAGEAAGVHFLAQQLVGEGATLDGLIESRGATGQPGTVQVAALFVQIADALEAAHAHGILHRDLKPRNILIDAEGRPRVGDFGLALRLGDSGAGHGLAGTCAYMSPEQAEGATSALDRRSDVFSLGAVLYEALTLRRAFEGDTAADVLDAVRDRRPPDPAALRRDVPRDLAAVCLKALEKQPAERYADMRAFADDLRRFLAHEPVLARRASAASRAWKWSRRHPARAMALLLGGVTLVVVATLLVRESRLRRDAEDRAAEARTQGYLANLRAAAAHLSRGNPVEAHQRLQACAPELRGWEWRYAQRLVDASVLLLPGHAGGATAVAVTPDGAHVVTGGGDSVLRLWDARGVLRSSLTVGQGGIRALDIAEDGRTVVACAADGTLIAGDLAGARVLASQPGGADALAIARDGRRALLAAQDGSARAFDLAAGTETALPAGLGTGAASIAVAADGSALVTGSPYGIVTLWTLPDASQSVELHGYGGAPAIVAIDDAGGCVAAGMQDGSVRAWTGPAWDEVANVPAHGRPVTAIALSADGRFIASASAGDEPVAVVDVQRHERVATLVGQGGRIVSLAVTAEGRRIVAGCADGTAYVWDRGESAAVRELLPAGQRVRSFAASLDGRVLAWCNGLDATASVLRDGQRSRLDLGPGPLTCVALAPDGGLLVAGHADGSVQAFDLRSERRRAALPPGGEPVTALAVTNDARLLVAGGSSLSLLEAPGGASRVLGTHTAPITSLAVCADGTRAATGSIDGSVRLWDPATGAGPVVQRDAPFDDHVLALDASGRFLAVALAAGGTIRILDARSGAEVAVLTDLESGVPCLAFDPRGQRLFTAAYNGRHLRVWDPALGENLFDFEDGSGGTTALAFANDSVYVVATDGRLLVREAREP